MLLVLILHFSDIVTLLMLSLVVTSKPFIESFPKDTTVIEGTRAEFPVLGITGTLLTTSYNAVSPALYHRVLITSSLVLTPAVNHNGSLYGLLMRWKARMGVPYSEIDTMTGGL